MNKTLLMFNYILAFLACIYFLQRKPFNPFYIVACPVYAYYWYLKDKGGANA